MFFQQDIHKLHLDNKKRMLSDTGIASKRPSKLTKEQRALQQEIDRRKTDRTELKTTVGGQRGRTGCCPSGPARHLKTKTPAFIL